MVKYYLQDHFEVIIIIFSRRAVFHVLSSPNLFSLPEYGDGLVHILFVFVLISQSRIALLVSVLIGPMVLLLCHFDYQLKFDRRVIL